MSMPRRVMRAALVLGGVGAVLAAPVEAGEARLQVVTVGGRAETQSDGATTWSAARLRTELGPGAMARTLHGRLTLKTTSGQLLRLAAMSRVAVLEQGAPDQPTAVRVDAGSVWVAVMPGSPAPERLEARTPAASVVVGGGGVEIIVDRDGSTLVRVYHGAATCSGPGSEGRWNRALGSGQELFVSSGGQPVETGKLDRDKINQDWAKWNEDQDLAGGYGSSPPEK
ncbi:MAG TPA: FecR domain-containing protein [Candidatus Methylomirabilis sp.]|nr:FecR domain-containing protein [Candidatus Methylomirabilis sp.]